VQEKSERVPKSHLMNAATFKDKTLSAMFLAGCLILSCMLSTVTTSPFSASKRFRRVSAIASENFEINSVGVGS
jgi:hypothetical protein